MFGSTVFKYFSCAPSKLTSKFLKNRTKSFHLFPIKLIMTENVFKSIQYPLSVSSLRLYLSAVSYLCL